MSRRQALQAVMTGMSGALGDAATASALEVPQGSANRLQPPRFSALPPGTVFAPAQERDGWRHRMLRGLAPNRFVIASVHGETCLQVEVNASASALVHRLDPPPIGSVLRWRWRSDTFPEAAALGIRERDDFAARVYLMFDLPQSRLTLADRLALASAGLLQGEALPAATLVYLFHAGDGQDRIVSSPFSDRVAMVVARASAQPNRWYQESRDWRHDFERAFGARYPGPVPAPSAVAVGADGDQTGTRLISAFGDLEFAANT